MRLPCLPSISFATTRFFLLSMFDGIMLKMRMVCNLRDESCSYFDASSP